MFLETDMGPREAGAGGARAEGKKFR